ncbi:hypothetical protein SFR_0249 [Streptomyces sp. FR-008]|nr:hypothetical protein SFR_0249 [Streptomyces sp. FR-008]
MTVVRTTTADCRRSRAEHAQPSAIAHVSAEASTHPGKLSSDISTCPTAAGTTHTTANNAARKVRRLHPTVMAPHPGTCPRTGVGRGGFSCRPPKSPALRVDRLALPLVRRHSPRPGHRVPSGTCFFYAPGRLDRSACRDHGGAGNRTGRLIHETCTTRPSSAHTSVRPLLAASSGGPRRRSSRWTMPSRAQARLVRTLPGRMQLPARRRRRGVGGGTDTDRSHRAIRSRTDNGLCGDRLTNRRRARVFPCGNGPDTSPPNSDNSPWSRLSSPSFPPRGCPPTGHITQGDEALSERGREEGSDLRGDPGVVAAEPDEVRVGLSRDETGTRHRVRSRSGVGNRDRTVLDRGDHQRGLGDRGGIRCALGEKPQVVGESRPRLHRAEELQRSAPVVAVQGADDLTRRSKTEVSHQRPQGAVRGFPCQDVHRGPCRLLELGMEERSTEKPRQPAGPRQRPHGALENQPSHETRVAGRHRDRRGATGRDADRRLETGDAQLGAEIPDDVRKRGRRRPGLQRSTAVTGPRRSQDTHPRLFEHSSPRGNPARMWPPWRTRATGPSPAESQYSTGPPGSCATVVGRSPATLASIEGGTDWGRPLPAGRGGWGHFGGWVSSSGVHLGAAPPRRGETSSSLGRAASWCGRGTATPERVSAPASPPR